MHLVDLICNYRWSSFEFVVSLVGFDLAIAASAARRAVITFMDPSIPGVHPHGGVREDLTLLEKLSTLFSQQRQILLLRAMAN